MTAYFTSPVITVGGEGGSSELKAAFYSEVTGIGSSFDTAYKPDYSECLCIVIAEASVIDNVKAVTGVVERTEAYYTTNLPSYTG